MRKKTFVKLNREYNQWAKDTRKGLVFYTANDLIRLNVASKLMYETLAKTGIKYQDILIKGGYHDFFDNYSRKEVTLNDAIGHRLTLGFLTHIFQKNPKFCKDDEVQSEYILPVTRMAIKTLNLKPKIIQILHNDIVNGWCLVKWLPQKTFISEEESIITGLKCKIFGFEECHPRYWRRFSQPRYVNMISHYRAIYIPRPGGMEAIYHTLHEERYFLKPNDPSFQHLTRIDWNKGLGYSLLQPVWDAITKLRERSDSDHFLKSNFMEARYPQTWTALGKAKKFIDKVRKASRMRGIAIEAVTDPHTKVDTGLPSVQYRPWGQGPTGQKMDENKASAYLDGEWLRLLVNLGYSQMWATGGNAGALEGSEINLTQDDRADIAQFSVLAPIIKDVLKRLAELGVMTAVGVPPDEIKLLISKNYEMVSWLTWEYNDKAVLQQEQLDHELEMSRGESDDRNKYDKSNSAMVKYNIKVQNQLIYAVRNRDIMPMTPVASSWIKSIGYEEGSLYMQTHDKTKQGIDTYEYNPPDEEAMYQDWVGSDSKGAFWWDWIEGVHSPAFKHGKPPAYLKTGYGKDEFGTPEETREYKKEGDPSMGIIGAGETREPYTAVPGDEMITSPGFYEEFSVFEQKGGTEYTSMPSIKGKAKSSVNPKGVGRKKKPGRKPDQPPSPYPMVYNPTNAEFKRILNSQKALSRFAKAISTDHNPSGWSMKPQTTYKIKELITQLIRSSFRINRVSFGNSIKAGHPYNYGGEDEFICPREYKKNIGKTVPLGIYHNRDSPGAIDLPEWQIIGTHEVLGWDDELGQEIAKNEYDMDKINALFEKIGETNWIQSYFDAGEEPPISGAYSCNVKKYNGKNFQMDIDLKSMSFVPDANCPWDICNFTPQEEVIA
jgi:hypothetical protein